jgi:hypothetical protein
MHGEPNMKFYNSNLNNSNKHTKFSWLLKVSFIDARNE